MLRKFYLLDSIAIPPQIEQFSDSKSIERMASYGAYGKSVLSSIIGVSRFLILSGPSGVGKSVVISHLTANSDSNINWRIIKRITTRTRRPNEADEELTFVSPSEFDALHCDGSFLYTESYPGTGAKYGVLKNDLVEAAYDTSTNTVFIIIGTLALSYLLPQSSYVYLVPPSVAEMCRRVESSKPNAEGIIDYDKKELASVLSLTNKQHLLNSNLSILCNDDSLVCARKIINIFATGKKATEIPDQLRYDIMTNHTTCGS
jgi:guanylate kinase